VNSFSIAFCSSAFFFSSDSRSNWISVFFSSSRRVSAASYKRRANTQTWERGSKVTNRILREERKHTASAWPETRSNSFQSCSSVIFSVPFWVSFHCYIRRRNENREREEKKKENGLR
jgi:hypothetical protein